MRRRPLTVGRTGRERDVFLLSELVELWGFDRRFLLHECAQGRLHLKRAGREPIIMRCFWEAWLSRWLAGQIPRWETPRRTARRLLLH